MVLELIKMATQKMSKLTRINDGKASEAKSNLHITEDNTENEHGID